MDEMMARFTVSGVDVVRALSPILIKTRRKQQTVSCFGFGVSENLLGAGDDMIFIIWLQFNSDKKRTQAWRMDCMSPQTLSDIPHTSCLGLCSDKLVKIRIPFPALHSCTILAKEMCCFKSRTECNDMEKDGKRMKNVAKNEVQNIANVYQQALPITVSPSAWFHGMQKATSTFLRLKQYWRQANKKVPVTTTSFCVQIQSASLFNIALLITHVRNISLAKQQQMHSITEWQKCVWLLLEEIQRTSWGW